MTNRPFLTASDERTLSHSSSRLGYSLAAEKYEMWCQMNGSEVNHAISRQSDVLPRLPELGYRVIRKNVSEELEKLKSAPSWQLAVGRSSETIVKYPDFRIVLIRMKPQSYMSHHRAEGPISVQAIFGRIRLHLPEDRAEDLGPGDLLTLEHGLEHDVEALEESAFLLTIAWPEAN
jgi:quercetin dioxygenase-like cupin family protein